MSKVSQLGAAPAALQTPALCRPHLHGRTHIHHQEAGRQHMAPGQRKAPQQVFAATVEVGELPAQEGQPGGRGDVGCWPVPILSCPRREGQRQRSQGTTWEPRPTSWPRGAAAGPQRAGRGGGPRSPPGAGTGPRHPAAPQHLGRGCRRQCSGSPQSEAASGEPRWGWGFRRGGQGRPQ